MRRMTVLLPVLVMLGAMLVGHGAAVAQETDPAVIVHPLVGSWLFFDQLQPRNPEGHWLMTFAADGTVTSAAQGAEFSAGHGMWTATGPVGATANLAVFMTTPDYGDELMTFHLTIAVSADGDQLTIDTTFDNVLADGSVDRGVVPEFVWAGLRISASPDQVVDPPAVATPVSQTLAVIVT